MKTLELDSLKLGGTESLFLISGPCVLEDEEKGEDFSFRIAERLVQVAAKLELPYIFKASYDKANRTSHESFRGPGLTRGLEILQSIKERLGVPILTDVHTAEQVGPASEVADILQVPAFLCRQTDLVQEAAKKAKIVNLKKGQFLSPSDVINVINKARHVGQENIMVTERGASFGYNTLVSDMGSIFTMRKFGYPVVFDATHSVQVPGGQGTSTGGRPEMIFPLCRAAVATGCDGLFIETHPDPSTALSDGTNALPLDQIEDLLTALVEIRRAVYPHVE